jgi:DNA-binding response OmpR family regulator
MPKKILAVDDEPLIQKTIERALSKVGYEVRTAPDAENFLEALAVENADLLIIDLHLGGINTESLVKKARDISPDSKVLLMSGSIPSPNDPYFLEKPFRIEELRAKVREMVGEAQ